MSPEISHWKNSPEGSAQKRHYDQSVMDFNSYLKKYYSDSDFFTWSWWNKWFQSFDAAFDKEKSELYKAKSGYYRVDYELTRYQATLENIKEQLNLPADILKVIAFLKEDGFFEEYKIDISHWMQIKNFANPKREVSISDHSINDLLKLGNGTNYIRERLIHLEWWDLTRGHALGR